MPHRRRSHDRHGHAADHDRPAVVRRAGPRPRRRTPRAHAPTQPRHHRTRGGPASSGDRHRRPLLTLTALSLFVFMAFTLVLIPVSILGLVAGTAVTALGVIAWGHRLGQLLPLRRQRAATAIGVAALIILLQLIGAVPVVCDVVVGFVLLSGLGAVTSPTSGSATSDRPHCPTEGPRRGGRSGGCG